MFKKKRERKPYSFWFVCSSLKKRKEKKKAAKYTPTVGSVRGRGSKLRPGRTAERRTAVIGCGPARIALVVSTG